jgi:hypothetical protein
MYRTSLTLASCTRRPAPPATCHPSTSRPAESMLLPRMSMSVPARPIGPMRNPATDIGSLLTTWIPPIAHRQRSMATTDRPTPRVRSMSTARRPTPSVTTLNSATTRRTTTMNMRRGRRCRCPTVHACGHDATMAMADGLTAIEVALSPDGWAERKRYPSCPFGTGLICRGPSSIRPAKVMGFVSLYPSYKKKKCVWGSEYGWKPSPATCWSLAPARPG